MLRVATYNLYCRPRHMFWDNQIQRVKKLAEQLVSLELDVICFQEIVDNKVHKMLERQMRILGFVHKTKRLSKKFRVNGGIITYSKYPIIHEDSIIFSLKKSYIWNAPAAKGAVFATIKKGEKLFNIVNTHLDSFKEEYRTSQLKHIKKYIDRYYTFEEPIIVCGDYNIDYHGEELENVKKIFSEYIYPTFKEDNKYSVSDENDWIDRRITSKDDPDRKKELLDFFIYNEHTTLKYITIAKPMAKQTVKSILFSTPFFFNIYNPFSKKTFHDLSDHYMTIADFK